VFIVSLVGSDYDMHPSVRQYYRRLMSKDELRFAHGRAASYFRALSERLSTLGRLDVATIADLCFHTASAGDLAGVLKLNKSYVEELKRAARHIYRDRDYPEALRWYEALYSMQSRDIEILAYLAKCYHRAAYSIQYLDRESGLDREERAAEALKHRNAANAQYQELYRMVQGSKDEWFVLRDYAHVLVATHRAEDDLAAYDEAQALFEKALALKPSDPSTVAGIAYMHHKLGDDVESEKGFRHVVDDLLHDHKYALYWLCRILIDKGKQNECSPYINRLQELYPYDDDTMEIADRMADPKHSALKWAGRAPRMEAADIDF